MLWANCIFLVLLTLIFFKTDQTGLVHLAAHVGLSYALNDTFYRINFLIGVKGIGNTALSAGLVLLIGLAYKLQENAPVTDIFRAANKNGIGILLAMLVRSLF